LQSQNRQRRKKRLALNQLRDLHGRLYSQLSIDHDRQARD
jgi:hypothetical protein